MFAGSYAVTRRRRAVVSITMCAALASTTAWAAGPLDAEALLATQRQSMQALSVFDGVWRGPARIVKPDGEELRIVQTERVGSFLGGTLKMIEGRGHGPDGSSLFNAFGVISYAPQTGRYSFHSYAQGYSGDFPMEVSADGFSWTIPAGPATLRYTATVKDHVWTEIGERLVDGQPPMRTFEMTLRRVGSTDWPSAGGVPAN